MGAVMGSDLGGGACPVDDQTHAVSKSSSPDHIARLVVRASPHSDLPRPTGL